MLSPTENNLNISLRVGSGLPQPGIVYSSRRPRNCSRHNASASPERERSLGQTQRPLPTGFTDHIHPPKPGSACSQFKMNRSLLKYKGNNPWGFVTALFCQTFPISSKQKVSAPLVLSQGSWRCMLQKLKSEMLKTKPNQIELY